MIVVVGKFIVLLFLLVSCEGSFAHAYMALEFDGVFGCLWPFGTSFFIVVSFWVLVFSSFVLIGRLKTFGVSIMYL